MDGKDSDVSRGGGRQEGQIAKEGENGWQGARGPDGSCKGMVRQENGGREAGVPDVGQPGPDWEGQSGKR